MQTSKRFAWLLIAIMSVISWTGISQLHSLWDVKIKAQAVSNYSAHTSLSIWESLATFRSDWPNLYKPVSVGTQSRLDLIKQFGFSNTRLKPISTSLNDISSQPLHEGQSSLGLVSTCISNSSNGFVMQADSIDDIQSGLKYFESRSDVVFTDVSIINSNKGFEVIFRNLCVIFRAGEI